MGHNIDFRDFGMCDIKCAKCGKELDYNDLDIDCDLKTHHPMHFELYMYCYNCEETCKRLFKITEIKEVNENENNELF